jgi:CMP-N,N'-diacetyllegionaminic acid synthase
MKILVVIPARGGSKRLPGKNSRFLGGKPLINWTIELANNLSNECDVIVSTDDPSIASLALKAGAKVPWLRPSELSSDEAKSADVALHALDWYESNVGLADGLLLLQPTSPFRSLENTEQAIKLFKSFEGKSVIGVSLANAKCSPALFPKLVESNQYLKLSTEDDLLQNQSSSQENTFYVPNGLIYLVSPSILRLRKSFFYGEIVPLHPTSSIEQLDIDTAEDWELAEAYLQNKVTE